MKKKVLYIIPIISTHLALGQQNTWQYYFDKPASIWEESIPLGNGRIGFMPWGGIDEERIVLNENSLWAGQKQEADDPESYPYLSKIRGQLFQKKNREAGEKTVQTYYNFSGWVTHILGNVWQFTSPSEKPSWGATNTTNTWLCQYLWQHYEYTLDKEDLKYIHPIIKEAASFFNDMLIENPNNGYLVTVPTTSPENKYISGDGDTRSIVVGSTMDNQLIRKLFTNTITATFLFDCDKDFAQQLKYKLKRLAPASTGKYGQIKEWIEDYEEVEPHHRHISQLYELFPGNEITYEKTPQLMEVAKITLNRRGGMSTGWSIAWEINLWTRLKDINRAYKLTEDLLTPAKQKSGTYLNLFSAHPPMQIDGDFGGPLRIMEMLIQSHAGNIESLPAIFHG